MHRIDVPSNIGQENELKDKNTKSNKKIKKKRKSIKINDNLFEIALRKGLIEKTENGYIFIGDHTDLLAFKSKGHFCSYDWLD
ncbi:MAG: hypothetical protein KAR55_06850 [Thermoplasmatales archaeon]|nr:hypothetical protein [Thermoplasmatales archaeon]